VICVCVCVCVNWLVEIRTIKGTRYMHKNNRVFSDRDPIMAVCQKLDENGKE
jgi:hypothetical protein